MAENKHFGLVLVAIVALVAVVGLVLLFTRGQFEKIGAVAVATPEGGESGALVGEAGKMPSEEICDEFNQVAMWKKVENSNAKISVDEVSPKVKEGAIDACKVKFALVGAQRYLKFPVLVTIVKYDETTDVEPLLKAYADTWAKSEYGVNGTSTVKTGYEVDYGNYEVKPENKIIVSPAHYGGVIVWVSADTLIVVHDGFVSGYIVNPLVNAYLKKYPSTLT